MYIYNYLLENEDVKMLLLGMVKGLHVYGQEGFNKFEENIQLELCRLNNKIESFGDCDFDVVALIQRSMTNVTSQLVSQSYQRNFITF
jgi:hypothetical protein